MAISAATAAGASDQPIDEYQMKAAFLFNFAKFVEWPAGSFQNPADPIDICIMGQDPFGRSLEATVAGKAVEGRLFVIRHIAGGKQVAGCHILFIAASERKAASTMAEIKAPGLLTVGDSKATLAAEGVVINFKLDAGKVRFEINMEASDRAKLHISSRLLSLAHVIDTRHK
jgi:hypothetical protein